MTESQFEIVQKWKLWKYQLLKLQTKQDKTLGPGWDSNLGKILPRPNELNGKWLIGNKKSYIEEPTEKFWPHQKETLGTYTVLEYEYYTSGAEVNVELRDYDTDAARKFLDGQKKFYTGAVEGRTLSTDKLNGDCFVYHSEKYTGQYVNVICIIGTDFSFDVRVIGKKVDSSTEIAFNFANIILRK